MTIHLMYEPNFATPLDNAIKDALDIAVSHRDTIYFRFNDVLVRVEPTDEVDEIRQHWSTEHRRQVNDVWDETGRTLEDYKREWRAVLEAEKGLSASYVRIREMVGAMDYEYPRPIDPATINTPAGQAGMWAHTEQKVANVVAERDHLAEAHKILAANSGALSRAYLRLRKTIGNMHNSPHGSEGAEAMYAFTEEELDRKLDELRTERDKAGRGYRRARGALQQVANRLALVLNESQISIEDRGTPAFQTDMLAWLDLLISQRDTLKLKCDDLQRDVDGLMRTPFPTSLHAEIILQKVIDTLAKANGEDSFKITTWAPGMLEDWALSAIRSIKDESGLVTTNWTFSPDILQETYDALAAQLEIPTVKVTTVNPMEMKTLLLKGIADLAQQRYDARIALLNMQGQRDEAFHRLGDWETNNLKGWIEVLPKGQRDAIYNVMERVGGLCGGTYWDWITGLEDQYGSPGFRDFRRQALYLYSTWRVACDALGYTVYNPRRSDAIPVGLPGSTFKIQWGTETDAFSGTILDDLGVELVHHHPMGLTSPETLYYQSLNDMWGDLKVRFGGIFTLTWGDTQS